MLERSLLAIAVCLAAPTTTLAQVEAQGDRTGYASVGGLEMYYEIHGEGPPLVLLHGALMAIDGFGDVLPALAETRQVIAVEQQAHGHTADIDRPFSYEQMADDTAALLQQLGIEQADIFGYSMGGDGAWRTRMWDRFCDHYLQQPMQKIVADRLRPAGSNDAWGTEQAKAQLHEAYGVLEQEIAARTWMIGDAFTLADCAAAPALFYASTVVPFGATQSKLLAYLGRLMARPSFARVLEEAEPYFPLFPMEQKPRIAGGDRQ